jgi:hypothetical protein
VNCWLLPSGIDGVDGVTAIESSCSGFTVSVALPEMLPDVAVISVEPVATVVANPAALMVATAVAAEVQVAVAVRFCVLLLVYVPVAVNCWVAPRMTEGLAGVTLIETKAAAVTVSVVLPEMLPETALIVVEPVPTVLPKPAALMVATVVAEELQVTDEVRFCWLLSVYVPVAVNCSGVPRGTDGFAGVTLIETKAAAVTESVVLPDMLPEVA